MERISLAPLNTWIGREQTSSDELTEGLCERFAATTGLKVKKCGAAPLGIHWCLTPEISPMEKCDVDGHPVRGDFLPPVPLARRMWAGARFEFFHPLRIGDLVKRTSKIEQIQFKSGRSGHLCFVGVANEYFGNKRLCLVERQTLVYCNHV